MTKLTKKQQTRVRIIRAVARDRSMAGCSARRVAKLARLHPATVRRHLAEMRAAPQEGLAVHVTSVHGLRGYTYRAVSVPRVRLPRRPKRVRVAPAPVPVTKPVADLQPALTVTARIVRELARPQGLHELGQVLRVKRNVLQRELDSLEGITRQRRGGRWIYSRVG